MPMTPIRSRSTRGFVPRKSTAALKVSAYRSGETALRGWPSLPPQNARSTERVTNPCSAILTAYKFALCSFTAPMGCPTMIAACFFF